MDIRIKRVYDPPSEEDGLRVLVDRLWPRGLSKARARLDDWLPFAAPSTSLRQWYGHDPARWAGFQRRYRAEFESSRPDVSAILDHARRGGRVTLLYATREREYNNAAALRVILLDLEDSSQGDRDDNPSASAGWDHDP